jgi:H+-transporting ATPase
MTDTDQQSGAREAGQPPKPIAVETLALLGSNSPAGLSSEEAQARFDREGPNDVPEKRVNWWLVFARKFWGLSAWMIELIAFLSLILQKYADFTIAMALLVVNALLSFLQEQRGSAAVAALRRQLQLTGRVLRDGSWRTLPVRELVPGDVVRVRSGDFVPADVQILDGELHVDQSALTGESRELARGTNEVVHSGSIVRQGEATGMVILTGVRTLFGRTTQLVESARPKLHVERVITRVVKWLFLIVGVQVAAALILSLVEGLPLGEVLPLTLVLLMSAVPVALPVMFTVSMAVGSVQLARRGVLVTRLSAAEDAANMTVLCADKTGTLTMNRLTLTGTLPRPGFTEEDVVQVGALASNEADQDPIDLAFLRAAQERKLSGDAGVRLSFGPFSPATRRTESIIRKGDRTVVRVMKGALNTIAQIAVQDPAERAAIEASAAEAAKKGYRILAVARANGDEPPRFVGLALLEDAPRPDSRRLLDELGALGVKVKMLTGDAIAVAQEISRQLGMGQIVRAPELRSTTDEARLADLVNASSGFAEVYPEDKFRIVQCLQASGQVVGMTGDGVNDAPALRQAEVGIAVSTATDVAKGAASVVLTTEGLANIVDLVKNGRAIYQRMLIWIINKISRTILKSGFVVIAFLVTGKFVISALAMVLLVFMTDFVKISLSTDRVRPSQMPETWNIGPLVRVAVILGLLMVAESLGLLAVGWHWFGLGQDDARLHMFTFQTLLFFALFSIVSIRERRAFWASRPSTLLAVALAGDACVGALIGTFGMAEIRPLPFSQMLLIVGYSLVCCLGINDLLKVILFGESRSPTKPSTS